MPKKLFMYLGLATALLLLITCFLPWTSYPDVNLTFTGFNVEPFATGNFYGKAGYPVAVLTVIVGLLFLIPRIWAKRLAVFIAGLLLSYTIRTYIIFTSGVVEGDVVKHAGIYLLVLCSALLFLSSLFPYMPLQKRDVD